MTGVQILALVFGVIAILGALFALAEVRTADKELVRVETWAEATPEHEMLKHALWLQLGLFVALGILSLIAVLSFTPFLSRVFTLLMFAEAVSLSATAIAGRVARLRILKMLDERPNGD